jgi:hypothetical protein
VAVLARPLRGDEMSERYAGDVFTITKFRCQCRREGVFEVGGAQDDLVLELFRYSIALKGSRIAEFALQRAVIGGVESWRRYADCLS